MAGHVCPWWGGYFIDNPLRRWIHNPDALLAPYLRPGDTAVDVGCGMGLFSLAMAKAVGPQGCVTAVDLQQQMLDVLMRRAAKAGLAERIRPHRCRADALDLAIEADFILAFAMVHEVPDTERLLREIAACLRPGGRFFVAEPRGHVSGETFDRMVELAASAAGLHPVEHPAVRWCRAVVFAK